MVMMKSMLSKEAQKITPAQIAAGGGISQSQEQFLIEEAEMEASKQFKVKMKAKKEAEAKKE